MAFKDIKGQDKAIERLRGEINSGHLAAAYLFSGPEGVGKNLAAKNFASALNCLEAKGDCCDCCVSCRKIRQGTHPDVHIIDNGACEEIKIDEIRQLEQEINLRPYEGKFKVFIINNAHNLNPVSGNAFLKTLEEPPKNSLIILVSDKPARLLKTIISRCRIVKFNSLERRELFGILQKDYDFDDNTLHYLAYFCEGRIGNALKFKDRDILQKKNMIIDGFISSPIESRGAADRDRLRDEFQILAGWFRDVYLMKAGLPEEELINLDRRDTLFNLMKQYSFAELDEIFNSISQSLLYLDQNINLKLLLANFGTALKKYH
jgi:DNA polymerase-3 subunit delta'